MSTEKLGEYKKGLFTHIDKPESASTSLISQFLNFARDNGLRESKLVSIFGAVLFNRGLKSDKEGLCFGWLYYLYNN